jgi:hypothetical protein
MLEIWTARKEQSIHPPSTHACITRSAGTQRINLIRIRTEHDENIRREEMKSGSEK